MIDRFGEAQGRAGSGVGAVLAVAGLSDTVGALRAAAVETLLVLDDSSSDATAWVGPEPVHIALTEEELTELGVRDPVQDRLDAALVRAAAGTDAAIVTLAAGQLELHPRPRRDPAVSGHRLTPLGESRRSGHRLSPAAPGARPAWAKPA